MLVWLFACIGTGELDYHQDAARQRLCNWVDECQARSTVFDFVTKGILQEAVRHCQYWRLADGKKKAPGLIGWWPSKAVTFVDNHDTGVSWTNGIVAEMLLSQPVVLATI
eukprot:GHRR01033560.1.p4 GENE.GHRR01033560.1~~GHRR01033560.1.p4  ORF type:complete len:110 (-),score=30.70 GHRR01033560.1:1376-1705(-)